ncbi:MAG: DUF3473 domain-containing protein [Chloroflexota bacterium]|nr:DUF3473 domain-containing protein [Chloroflexota bacterium]MDQ5864731.1 DUF3473 domain-containing protein [Chloroflexota bacterium]
MADTSLPVNGISVDVEDWFQAFDECPLPTWERHEHRLTRSLERTLQLFEEQGVKATFFVLGYNAERYPHLVSMIRGSGHELGTHGYSHRLIYTQTPGEFREEMKRAIGVVEEISGERVIGHRAAAFSITPRSIWALDVLLELGIRYDSSIFPVRHYRYGWPGAPEGFCRIKRESGSIVELPLPTWRFGKLRLPVGGGAYQRIFPEFYIYAALRRINRGGQRFVLYMHPWELDPAQPRAAVQRHVAWSHYANLKNGWARYARMLREFRFAPLRELAEGPYADALPEVTLD